MKISTDTKIKVFVQYLGHKVIFGYEDNKKNGTLIGNCEPFGLQVFNPSNAIVPHHNVNPDLIHLILKPLSEITDEDAIQVAKIILGGKNWNVKRYDKHIHYLDIVEASAIQSFWVVNIFFLAGSITLNLHRPDEGDTHKSGDVLPAYQYLISKGYDLPHYLLEGKTLQQAGLAIYENK